MASVISAVSNKIISSKDTVASFFSSQETITSQKRPARNREDGSSKRARVESRDEEDVVFIPPSQPLPAADIQNEELSHSKDAVASPKEAFKKLIEGKAIYLFGKQFGDLDRNQMAALILSFDGKLAKMEACTHALIGKVKTTKLAKFVEAKIPLIRENDYIKLIEQLSPPLSKDNKGHPEPSAFQASENLLVADVQEDAKADVPVASVAEKDFLSELDKLVRLADQNDATAQLELGKKYEEGNGVAQNFRLAIDQYQKAAKQCNAEACFRLARCFSEGHGVPKHVYTAAFWLKIGAETGHAECAYTLACLFYPNKLLPDFLEGIYWHEKAAQNGHVDSMYQLGKMWEIGWNPTSQSNPEKAVQWYEKAAEHDHPQAMLALGLCYETGRGVPKDFVQSAMYFRKAGLLGLLEAQSRYVSASSSKLWGVLE
eukprot:TRINITY_DN2505_c0_g1::TRINITY_DN2505_c0_g1_i1::g.19352::m.19352 TRINITY_DN2505_c0_g1::TRINITY_DN2505_c0_g1_i1::g.19352  ORF type:complete len:430 (+),score=21.13,sp/P77234/YBEQ_ECOLI/32.18/5e-18,sp/P77234/YBEQ_ECOLI/35.94/7e-12,sp/P77234/YBEQ_ECOLI/31.14/2e-11,sp/P77234/YBEQ_ECOLI/28.42/6e-11,sp/P77234/YBEQ_ECOLI/27.27/8e-09,Sel1/PF08238.7/0.00014,Sel1/PF08238.7/0.0006,Sel1/PF08238.7/0.42,Sel1/PF08238.7/1.5e-08,Sel1/PF08238.7/3.7e-07,TPR_11/PF13414.1/3.5,TPR_11/PF13414.1/4.9e+03,TPR_11/PF13414.1